MLKKSFTAAVAALTMTVAIVAAAPSAEARGLGQFVAAGIVGVAVGAAAAAASSRPAYGEPVYEPAYRPAYGPVGYGCGYHTRPVFDDYGDQIGVRRIPNC